MSSLLQEVVALELGWREPWADDSKLFQPHEDTQAQSNERAQSLAVQCFLRMCGLQHVVEQRMNAEFISPTGTTPVLKCGSFILSELESIVSFVSSKGVSLTSDLSQAEKADFNAYFSLAQTLLSSAELYFSWISEPGYEITFARYGSVYPWPLNGILSWRKRREVKKLLNDWSRKHDVEVFEEIESCVAAFSKRLADGPFFFGEKPTELDALVFGHLFVLLHPGPEAAPGLRQIAPQIAKFPNLVKFCTDIESRWFEGELQ